MSSIRVTVLPDVEWTKEYASAYQKLAFELTPIVRGDIEARIQAEHRRQFYIIDELIKREVDPLEAARIVFNALPSVL